MPRTLVLLIALLALAVGTASAPALAAEDDYPARIPTRTDVEVRPVVGSGTSFVVRVTVRANSVRAPKGTVKVTVTRLTDRAGARTAARGGEQVWSATTRYEGGQMQVDGPTLRELGRYRVLATYEPDERSIFRGSQGGDVLRVVAGAGPDDGGNGGDGDENGAAVPGGAAGGLPDTGGPGLWLLLLGLGLVGSGSGLVVLGRRRRPTPSFV